MICNLRGEDTGDWKRKEVDSTRLPFYVNNRTGELLWDHPEFRSIMEATEKFEEFKYCTYRTAFKIRSIQKALKWNLITLPKVISALEESKFGLDGSPAVTCQEVECCLLLLYANAKKDIGFAENAATLADLMLNFLLNVFLPKRNKAMVSSLQVQVVLILMCAERLLEKYKYIYRYISIACGGVSRKNLELLFGTLWKIPTLCGENLCFGSHFVHLAVESLFHSAGSDVTEEKFLNWIEREPQNLVWAPALYRISISETVLHEAQCAVCLLDPIVGLRFRCLYCLSYNLCQHCFLRGSSNGTHIIDHPTREYVHQATCWDEGQSALTILKNRLFSKRRARNLRSFELPPNFLERACVVGNTKLVVCNDSVQKELNVITAFLESANRKLSLGINAMQESHILSCGGTTNCPSGQMLVNLHKFLEEHYNLVNLEVHHLKLLIQYLDINEDSKNMSREGEQNETQGSQHAAGLNTWSKVAQGDGSVTWGFKDLPYTITDLTAGYSSCDSIRANLSTTSQPSRRKASTDRTQGESLVAVSFESLPCTLDISTTGDASSFKSKYECDFAASPNSTIKVTNGEVLNIVKDIDGLFSLPEGLPNGCIQQEREKFLKAVQMLREKLIVACSALTTDSAQSTNL